MPCLFKFRKNEFHAVKSQHNCGSIAISCELSLEADSLLSNGLHSAHCTTYYVPFVNNSSEFNSPVLHYSILLNLTMHDHCMSHNCFFLCFYFVLFLSMFLAFHLHVSIRNGWRLLTGNIRCSIQMFSQIDYIDFAAQRMRNYFGVWFFSRQQSTTLCHCEYISSTYANNRCFFFFCHILLFICIIVPFLRVDVLLAVVFRWLIINVTFPSIAVLPNWGERTCQN